MAEWQTEEIEQEDRKFFRSSQTLLELQSSETDSYLGRDNPTKKIVTANSVGYLVPTAFTILSGVQY